MLCSLIKKPCMIEIIKEEVAMPDVKRYQFGDIVNKKWHVIDTHMNNIVRYIGNYQNSVIACHNLNKKHYQDNPL